MQGKPYHHAADTGIMRYPQVDLIRPSDHHQTKRIDYFANSIVSDLNDIYQFWRWR